MVTASLLDGLSMKAGLKPRNDDNLAANAAQGGYQGLISYERSHSCYMMLSCSKARHIMTVAWGPACPGCC